LTPYDPIGDFRSASTSWPEHLFGTDNIGRDILRGALRGAHRPAIGFIATYVPFVYGSRWGQSGYFGGWFDTLLMAGGYCDCVSFLVLIIVILAILGPGIDNMYIAVFAVAWTMYRAWRAEMLVIREQEYIRGAGVRLWSRAHHFRHALPNLIGSSLVFSMSDLCSTSCWHHR
jgi:peptide/nickel transport system permease protein